jgi:hypothetical protein
LAEPGDALFAAFAVQPDLAPGEVEVVAIRIVGQVAEAGQLGQAHAGGGPEQFDDREVAALLEIFLAGVRDLLGSL